MDFVLLIAIGYAAWRGFRAGLIIELFTLMAIVIGLYFAIHFSDYVSGKIEDDFDLDKMYLSPTAFLITFLAIGAGVYFLGKTLEKIIKTTGLSPLNKLAGLMFSVLKMAFILSALLIYLETMEERKEWKKKDWKENSVLYSPLLNVGKVAIPGLKTSTIFIQNALEEEQKETGLTVDEILRAKKVADSLDLQVEDAQKLKGIHDAYDR